MTNRHPGQWPVDEPVGLDTLSTAEPTFDELYMRRQKERALHEMVLGSIRHDLEQQPSPVCVLTAARDWCSRITAVAEEITRSKRSTA